MPAIDRLALLCIGAGLLAQPAAAAVSERFTGGFALRYERSVAAAPRQVLRAFGRIGRWWDPAHTYSGKAGALRLDLRLGGCFCERAGGLQVRHLQVERVEAGRIVLSGALGPLQSLAVRGVMVVEAEATASGTTVRWTYRVAGDDPVALDGWADRVDHVMAHQFERFATHLRGR